MVIAQNSDVSTGSLYDSARDAISEKKYEKARLILKELTERRPENIEYKLMIARTFLWEKSFSQAKEVIREIQLLKPDHKEAFIISYKCHLWNDDPNGALRILNNALIFHAKDEDILYEKAKVLVKVEKVDQAISVLEDILERNPDHEKAKELLMKLKTSSLKNRLGGGYLYNYYSSNNNPLNGVTLRYSRLTSVGRMIFNNHNFNRFGKWGHQFEVDAYPRLMKGVYAYANAGYSRTSLFPKYRAGFEPFISLPYSLELSLGFRYLQFVNSDVLMYSGSLGKYYKNHWLNLRTFIIPKEVSFSRTFLLEYRYYGKNQDNFWFLRTGYGASPDDQSLNPNIQTVLFLPSYKLATGLMKSFRNRWFFRSSLSAQHQELTTGKNILISVHLLLDYAF